MVIASVLVLPGLLPFATGIFHLHFQVLEVFGLEKYSCTANFIIDRLKELALEVERLFFLFLKIVRLG